MLMASCPTDLESGLLPRGSKVLPFLSTGGNSLPVVWRQSVDIESYMNHKYIYIVLTGLFYIQKIPSTRGEKD